MIHRPSKALRAGDYLADMQEAIRLIAEYTHGLTVEQRNLAMWRHLRGAYDMRIKLTHGYRSVNDRIVWNTAADYLPELSMCIEAEQARASESLP